MLTLPVTWKSQEEPLPDFASLPPFPAQMPPPRILMTFFPNPQSSHVLCPITLANNHQSWTNPPVHLPAFMSQVLKKTSRTALQTGPLETPSWSAASTGMRTVWVFLLLYPDAGSWNLINIDRMNEWSEQTFSKFPQHWVTQWQDSSMSEPMFLRSLFFPLEKNTAMYNNYIIQGKDKCISWIYPHISV